MLTSFQNDGTLAKPGCRSLATSALSWGSLQLAAPPGGPGRSSRLEDFTTSGGTLEKRHFFPYTLMFITKTITGTEVSQDSLRTQPLTGAMREN